MQRYVRSLVSLRIDLERCGSIGLQEGVQISTPDEDLSTHAFHRPLLAFDRAADRVVAQRTDRDRLGPYKDHSRARCLVSGQRDSIRDVLVS